MTKQELYSALRDCRNELCLKCEQYKMAHKGACDGCRWKDMGCVGKNEPDEISDILDLLNTIRSNGNIEYSAYSQLHDAISVI